MFFFTGKLLLYFSNNTRVWIQVLKRFKWWITLGLSGELNAPNINLPNAIIFIIKSQNKIIHSKHRYLLTNKRSVYMYISFILEFVCAFQNLIPFSLWIFFLRLHLLQDANFPSNYAVIFVLSTTHYAHLCTKAIIVSGIVQK